MAKRGKKPSLSETKPVYKCNICVCDCQREVDCGCPCTKHFWYNCPKKDRKQGTRGGRGRSRGSYRGNRGKGDKKEDKDPEQANGPTFLTYMRKVSEGVLCVAPKEDNTMDEAIKNINQLKQYLHFGGNLEFEKLQVGERISMSNNRIYLSINDSIQEKNKQVNMVIDTASPSTICGAKLFKRIFAMYPTSISFQFEYEPSTKQFEFGGGTVTSSLGKVKIPVYFQNEHGTMNQAVIAVEVVQQDIIFLLGSKSLSASGAQIDYQSNLISFNSFFGKDTRFPINPLTSGHIGLQFFVSSNEDGEKASRLIFEE